MTYREAEVQLHWFLTCALDGDKQSTPRSSRFNPSEEPRRPLNMRLGGPQGRSGR